MLRRNFQWKIKKQQTVYKMERLPPQISSPYFVDSLLNINVPIDRYFHLQFFNGISWTFFTERSSWFTFIKNCYANDNDILCFYDGCKFYLAKSQKGYILSLCWWHFRWLCKIMDIFCGSYLLLDCFRTLFYNSLGRYLTND